MNYSLTYREVVEILTLVKESASCAHLSLQLDDFKLNVQSRSTQTSTETLDSPRAGAATPEALTSRPATSANSNVVQERGSPEQAASERESQQAELFVRAPMLGFFYRSPQPGSPPFIQIGDKIASNDVVGVLEVMKLFSPVAAGVAGKVVEILVEDGQMVEYEQPLMRVVPFEARDP